MEADAPNNSVFRGVAQRPRAAPGQEHDPASPEETIDPPTAALDFYRASTLHAQSNRSW